MAKKKKKKRKKKAAKKAAKKALGRPRSVAKMSVAQLERVIARRKRAEARELKAKRAKAAKALAALDKQVAALTGAAPKRGPGRPKKKKVGRPKKKKLGRPKKKKLGRPKKKVAKKAAKKKAGRLRSSPDQIAKVQAAILRAVKRRKAGLLRVEITKAVPGRPQTLATALKKLLDAKQVTTKGVTRNMRYTAK